MAHDKLLACALAIATLACPPLERAQAAAANRPRLDLQWPANWEYRAPVQRGSVVQLQARHQESGNTVQQLTITILGRRSAGKPVTTGSLKDLVGRLRDSVLPTASEGEIPIQPLRSARGFYFVATARKYIADLRADYQQLVEGALLDSQYLITFTLLSNDVDSAATRQMIAALDALEVL